MAEVLPGREARLAWTPRLLGWSPRTVVLAGCGGAGAFLALFVAYFFTFGLTERLGITGPSYLERGRLWESMVTAVLLGYLPVLTSFGLRGARADLIELRTALVRNENGFRQLLEQVTTFRRSAQVPLALAAASVAIFGFLQIGSRPWPGAAGFALPVWDFGRVFLLCWFLFRAAYFDVSVTRLFARLAREEIRVDLWDPDPLRAFASRGLRTVLLWVIASVIFSFFVIDPWRGGADPVALLLLVFFAISAVWPVFRVHQRIRQRKRAELSQVRARMRQVVAEDAIAGDPEAIARRLGGLLAYEAHLDAVADWPFGISTVLRFGLYLAIGLGSWLGAALVERGLTALLE